MTINTDNRLITDTSVSKELYLVHTEMGVPFRDIKSMVIAGFKSAFMPFHEKQAALRRITQELSRYDDSGHLRDEGPLPERTPKSSQAPASASPPAQTPAEPAPIAPNGN